MFWLNFSVVFIILFFLFMWFSADSFFCLLIGLEGIMVWMFYMLSVSIGSGAMGFIVGVVFMAMMVVEGAFGIGVMLYSVGKFGEDYFFNVSSY